MANKLDLRRLMEQDFGAVLSSCWCPLNEGWASIGEKSKSSSEQILGYLALATVTGFVPIFWFGFVEGCFLTVRRNSQFLLYWTGVGTKISSPVYKKSGISEYQTVENILVSCFLRDWNSQSGMCDFRYNRVRYKTNWLYLFSAFPVICRRNFCT